MNILILNHYAGSPEMGMEFRPYYFAREWIKMGHRVDIIAADYSHLRRMNPVVDHDFQEQVIDGIHYHWIQTGTYEGNGAKRAMTMFRFVSKLWLKAKKIINALSPDVVIASSTYPLDTYVGQRIRKLSKKKVKLIHEVHDMWPATLIEIGGMSKWHPFVVVMQIGENSAYKNSDTIVSLLPNAEQYMRAHGLKEGKFICIPNGIVLEEWDRPEELPKEHQAIFETLKLEKKFIVGYFGGHALSNALDILLDIATQIEDRNVQFVLVGDGVEKVRLMKKAERLSLNNVTFMDSIPKRAIPTLCEMLDCIYMGEHDSPLQRFGLCLNKMFDCMASGKPSICVTAMESYFTEYNCGYDMNASNIKAICKRIENVKQLDMKKLEEIRENGQRAAQRIFNYKSLAERFIDVMMEENDRYEKNTTRKN